MFNVIATGSTGNAVLYHNSILIDCGVPYASLRPYLYDIQIVLLTHEHGDHFKYATLKRLQTERPTLRIGCCEWMAPLLAGLRNIDIYDVGTKYDYHNFSITPVKLYHDVENCGYRIFKGSTKIFHATDTAHLQGIEAKGYDLYAIEHNYNEDTVYDLIAEKTARGEFAHQKGSINSHLSEQRARDFIFKNGGPNAKTVRLHESQLVIV